MKFLLFYLLTSSPGYSIDTAIHSNGYFIAMEYKGMSNCIYKVIILDSLILGAKVNGEITVQGSFGIGHTVPQDQMHRPGAYVDSVLNEKYKNQLSGETFDEQGFLEADKDNFIIRKTDIKKVSNNPKKKFGMGYYPYGGRIILETIKTLQNRKSERELILVGDQDPEEVLKLIRS